MAMDKGVAMAKAMVAAQPAVFEWMLSGIGVYILCTVYFLVQLPTSG